MEQQHEKAASEWLTAKDVAGLWECTPRAVYDMIAQGKLPARPHGTRSWRISRQVVEEMGRGAAAGGFQALVRAEVDRYLRELLTKGQVA